MTKKKRKPAPTVVHQVIDGEFFWWPWKTKHICCHCGLTHDVEMIAVKAPKPRLVSKWTVDDRETTKQRALMNRRKK